MILQPPALSSGLAVICRVGSIVCALPAEHVAETMRPLPVEPLAGMPLFIAGVSIVRGAPVPVVDVARLLGGTGPLPAGRFVSIRIGGRRAAIAVDAVLGVRSLRTGTLHDLPPLLRDASADVVGAMGTLDAELLILLQSACIVPKMVWEALDAGGSRS